MEETWAAISGSDVQNTLQYSTRPARREVYICWLAPPLNWITLNTDGAAKGTPGEAGDSRGVFIRGFAANLGVCNAYKAELLAAELGLEMAVNWGIQKLILQMDNQACFEGMKNTIHSNTKTHSENLVMTRFGVPVSHHNLKFILPRLRPSAYTQPSQQKKPHTARKFTLQKHVTNGLVLLLTQGT